MFYIKVRNLEFRDALIGYLKEKYILAAFHYVPLHSAEAGKRLGVFYGTDTHTTVESEKLLRLPMYFNMTKENLNYTLEAVISFFSSDTYGNI
jgi:dTDP-4-amino-4,6-dideoxygalactose transaminase